jgi:hypothetical protein
LLGVDTAGIKRCGGCKCRPAERSGNESLQFKEDKEN